MANTRGFLMSRFAVTFDPNAWVSATQLGLYICDPFTTSFVKQSYDHRENMKVASIDDLKMVVRSCLCETGPSTLW